MSSLALRLPRASLDTTAWAFAVATKLLHELIEQPANLFLLALGAMLFRPPDLKTFPIDRVAFFVLIGAAAFRFCITRQRLHLHAASLPMLIMTALAFSNVVLYSYHAEAWSLFAAKWAVPVVLFHVAGSIFKDESSLRKLEVFSLAALAYLIAISVFFLFDIRSLIVPKFILDETIGIHSDRARGPFLQAVANGVCINILALLALHSFDRKRLQGIGAFACFIGVPLALLATRTRTVWLSGILSVFWLGFLAPTKSARRLVRWAAVFAVAACIALLVYTPDWNQLSERLNDRSPVEFRAAVYRAGWEMFAERPLTGWGSNEEVQLEVRKHVTDFRADYYVFHNTYLELAVEHGVLGLVAYGWLMFTLFRLGQWHPRAHQPEPLFLGPSFRALWPLMLSVYLLNASAVVMNYQFVNGFVFTIAGILAAQDQSNITRTRETFTS